MFSWDNWYWEKENERLTSISGSCKPSWESTFCIKASNFGLIAFAAGPPSTPYALNLWEGGKTEKGHQEKETILTNECIQN